MSLNIRKSVAALAFAAALFAAPASFAAAYCQKGDNVETRWGADWLPRTVTAGPNELGQCQLADTDGNPPQWVSRDRIRPVGGGEFAAAPAAAPAPAPAAPGGPAIVAPEMVAPPTANNGSEISVGGEAPKTVKAGDMGDMIFGVYMCSDEKRMYREASFGIVDGRSYRAYEGTGGRYNYNRYTGLLEFYNGANLPYKYKRTSKEVFTMLDGNARLTKIECVFKLGKDPRAGGW